MLTTFYLISSTLVNCLVAFWFKSDTKVNRGAKALFTTLAVLGIISILLNLGLIKN